METHKICELCGAHNYDKEERHGWVDMKPCPKMSAEDKENLLITYFQEYQNFEFKLSCVNSHNQHRLNKARGEKEFWKGKYYTVKQENNKLRKKNYEQGRKDLGKL